MKNLILKAYNKLKENGLLTGIVFAIFGAVIILTAALVPGVDIVGGCVIGGMLLIAGGLSIWIEKLEAKDNKK